MSNMPVIGASQAVKDSFSEQRKLTVSPPLQPPHEATYNRQLLVELFCCIPIVAMKSDFATHSQLEV